MKRKESLLDGLGLPILQKGAPVVAECMNICSGRYPAPCNNRSATVKEVIRYGYGGVSYKLDFDKALPCGRSGDCPFGNLSVYPRDEKGNKVYAFQIRDNMVKEACAMVAQTAPAWDMTPKQFHEFAVRFTMQKYSCSRQEAEYCHTREQTDVEHFRAVKQAMKDGTPIRKLVIDKLSEAGVHELQHDLPDQFQRCYPRYIMPQFR